METVRSGPKEEEDSRVRPTEKIDTNPRRVIVVDHQETTRSRQLALAAVEAALEKKALEPVLLDVHQLASYTDFILVVSGRSDRQVMAISDGIVEALGRERVRPLGTEGQKGGQWTLLDFGDLIVHVFYHPVRDFYDLESFWIDAPRVPLQIPDEARIGVDEAYK
jgi:ribosome-associated protein